MSPWLLLVLGGGALLIILGVYYVATSRVSDTEKRVEVYVRPAARGATPQRSKTSVFSSMRRVYNSLAGALYSEKRFHKLASANWQLTVAEYMLIRVLSMVFLIVICWVALDQPILGIALGLLANYGLEYLLNSAISRRTESFKSQFVDVLILLSSSLRAGLNLSQAIEVVANEMTPPASDEFRRVKKEVEVGIPLSQALLNLSQRMQNDDLDLVVTAININLQAGGNLTRIMDRVAETIRDRVRLQYESRALTAYARYTSMLLTFLPFIVVGIIYILSPGYFGNVLPPKAPVIVVAIPIVLIALGNFWIGRITRSIR